LYGKKGAKGIQKKFPKLLTSNLVDLKPSRQLNGGTSKQMPIEHIDLIPDILVRTTPVKDSGTLTSLCNELTSACWNNDLAGVRTLLQDVDIDFFINRYNPRGHTPLYCATRQGHTAIVAELLAVPSVDPDVQMLGHLSTALHVACYHCHPEICAMLLFSGASMLMKNANELTCEQEALNAQVANVLETFCNEGLEGIKKLYPGLEKGKKNKRRSSLSERVKAIVERKEIPREKEKEERLVTLAVSAEPAIKHRSRTNSTGSREALRQDLMTQVYKVSEELEMKMNQASLAMTAPHPLDEDLLALLVLLRRVKQEAFDSQI